MIRPVRRGAALAGTVTALLVVAMHAACSGNGGPPDGGPDLGDDLLDASPLDGDAPDGDDAGVLRIVNIQNRNDVRHPDPGTTVSVAGVVAITPKALLTPGPAASCEYGVWVADPEGGSYSGILVVTRVAPAPGASGCPEPAGAGDALPADTAPGDVLDVTGVYEEQRLPFEETGCLTDAGDPCSASYARLVIADEGTRVVRTGDGAELPRPLLILGNDAGGCEVAELALRGEATDITDRVRGALVELPNIRVIDPEVAPGVIEVEPAEICPGGEEPPRLRAGRQPGFAFDAELAAGEFYSALRGVLAYNQITGHWTILPRSNDDLVP